MSFGAKKECSLLREKLELLHSKYENVIKQLSTERERNETLRAQYAHKAFQYETAIKTRNEAIITAGNVVAQHADTKCLCKNCEAVRLLYKQYVDP